MRLRWVIAFASLWLGCSSVGQQAPPIAGLWQHPELLEHPLVGRAWDARQGSFVTLRDVAASAGRHDYVLIGEKHDNADHHRMQAWLIQQMLDAQRRPAVVFEMLPTNKREAVARHRSERGRDVDGFAEAVAWGESGWPEWELYRPVFETALLAGLAVVPGDVPRATLHGMRGKGLESLGRDTVSRLSLDAPLEDTARERFAEAIRESHCGMAPESSIAPMIDMQRARDAFLADSLLGAGEHAVLIAGNGHTMRGAVPAYLARRAPERSVLAIGLLEVDAERTTPGEYVSSTDDPEFDLVWFTTRVDNEDPCEKFREQLKRLRK